MLLFDFETWAASDVRYVYVCAGARQGPGYIYDMMSYEMAGGFFFLFFFSNNSTWMRASGDCN